MVTRNLTQSSANAAASGALHVIAELVNDLVALANEVRTDLRTRILAGDPGFAVNSNFDIANGTAFAYMIDGVPANLAASQNFDTGTTEALAADKWGVALLSVDADGNTTVTWAGTDYDDEATALANIPAPPASECPVGVVTVKTASGQTWTAGTDALKGGAGGNPASETNFYDGALQPVSAAAVDDISFRSTGAP